MSFDAFLNQTCTITRSQATALDRHNNAVTTPMVVLTDVRCRKTQKTMRLMDKATSEYAFIHADLVLFAAETDVRPGDELTISGKTWTALELLKRQRMNAQHHLSVIVEALNAR